MSNVVSLGGNIVLEPNVTVPETVAELEDLLERARSGNIKGFHAVIIYGDDSAGTISTLMPSYRAIGALSCLANQFAYELNNEE